MTDATTKEKTPAEKQAQKKKKELRDLKSRIKQLRETARSAIDERRQMESRVETLTAELGLPPKVKKDKTAA